MAIDVKKILADALLALSQEKALSRITVREIISQAGTGRQTFYNHFRDKNDLIYWIFLRTLAGENYLVKTKGFFAYLLSLHEKAQEKRSFFAQACKLEGQNSLSEAICRQTFHYYKTYIEEHFGNQVLTEELLFALQFNAHGASSRYIAWAEAGMPGSAELQARCALHCIPACIKRYLPICPEDLELDRMAPRFTEVKGAHITLDKK